jgi:hypothetical protein
MVTREKMVLTDVKMAGMLVMLLSGGRGEARSAHAIGSATLVQA